MLPQAIQHTIITFHSSKNKADDINEMFPTLPRTRPSRCKRGTMFNKESVSSRTHALRRRACSAPPLKSIPFVFFPPIFRPAAASPFYLHRRIAGPFSTSFAPFSCAANAVALERNVDHLRRAICVRGKRELVTITNRACVFFGCGRSRFLASNSAAFHAGILGDFVDQLRFCWNNAQLFQQFSAQSRSAIKF